MSGEQHSLGEGDLSRLVTGSKWRPAGPWCPGVSVLFILCSCPLCIVPCPPPATPSTGIPFSERNSSRSTYCNRRITASFFFFFSFLVFNRKKKRSVITESSVVVLSFISNRYYEHRVYQLIDQTRNKNFFFFLKETRMGKSKVNKLTWTINFQFIILPLDAKRVSLTIPVYFLLFDKCNSIL